MAPFISAREECNFAPVHRCYPYPARPNADSITHAQRLLSPPRGADGWANANCCFRERRTAASGPFATFGRLGSRTATSL